MSENDRNRQTGRLRRRPATLTHGRCISVGRFWANTGPATTMGLSLFQSVIRSDSDGQSQRHTEESSTLLATRTIRQPLRPPQRPDNQDAGPRNAGTASTGPSPGTLSTLTSWAPTARPRPSTGSGPGHHLHLPDLSDHPCAASSARLRSSCAQATPDQLLCEGV
jgi:hypothetical protein